MLNKIVLGLLIASTSMQVYAQEHSINHESVKNVIVMIPDGMSVSGTTLARLYKGEPLAMDPLATGLMATWSGDGTIADSAPAGTAIATGWKAQSGNVGITGKVYDLPNAREPEAFQRPVATLLEAARLQNKATGVVSTSEFMHATPADFSAHDPARSHYDNIVEQQIYNGLSVILGGGAKYLKAENRKDNEDIESILTQRGYTIARDTAELKNFSGNKLVGVFGKSDEHTALSYDLDRDPVKEPSIAEMTTKAIEVLSKNPEGFVLMVEGSKVDWAAHANDPVGIVTDILAFDNAVNKALEFAKKDGNTLLVVVSDHGNSGISIGSHGTDDNYDETHWSTFVNPLKQARLTGEGFEQLLAEKSQEKELSYDDIRALAKEWLDIELADSDIEKMLKSKKGDMNYVIGPIIARKANIGFTTSGHTGEDVVLYSYDPRGRLLGGVLDNTEVNAFIADSLAVDLDKTTERLFKNAKKAFEHKDAEITEDFSDVENPVLIVKKGDQTLRIPRNKSIAWLNDLEVQSDGVNVYNGTDWFISEKLVNLIQ